MCGVEGHHALECTSPDVMCFKCGNLGHKSNDYRGGAVVICYNCGETSHISSKSDQLKNDQVRGKVFSISGSETAVEDRLI